MIPYFGAEFIWVGFTSPPKKYTSWKTSHLEKTPSFVSCHHIPAEILSRLLLFFPAPLKHTVRPQKSLKTFQNAEMPFLTLKCFFINT